MSRIPLAWKNLVHDRRRLFMAIGGIVFAVILMFTQTGFRNGLFDSTVAILRTIDGDIVIFSRAKFSLISYQRFPMQILDLAGSVEGVQSVHPIYTENPFATIRNIAGRADGRGRPIRVIAADLDAGLLKNVDDQQAKLLVAPQSALIDSRTKSIYGFSIGDQAKLVTEAAELGGRRLQIVGTFDLGTDFAHDGNLLMSPENFAFYFPQRNLADDPLAIVDIGIVRLADGANRGAVVRRLRGALPSTIRVSSMDRYQRDEIHFWATNTPIGTIFLIGTIMGFVVGTIICYQVLATDIADHLSEFATLKAMGYSNLFFFKLVLTESIYLSLLGFIPGLLLTALLYQFASALTGLVMTLTLGRVLLVYALTLTMCVVSGLIAVRKLAAADPASLF